MSLWLAKDQKSNDVVALQNALNAARPKQTPLVLDGVFGKLTEAAVHDFQKLAGLKADGIAGPRTLSELFEGVDVKSTVKITAAEKQPARTRVSAPSAASARPQQQGVSLGAIGVLNREFQVRNWAQEGFPKKPLHLGPWTPPALDVAAMEHDGILVDRLQKPLGSSAGKDIHAKRGMCFEAEASVATSDFKELEYNFTFKILQPKKDGFFKPSVSMKGSPDGGWIVTTKVTATPFHILDWEWWHWSAEFNPSFAASYTAPILLGDDPEHRHSKLGFFAGAEGMVTWRPFDRLPGFALFFGGKLGALGFARFEHDRVVGGFKGDWELTGGIRFERKPRERKH